jgi:hypothetical protein
MVAKQVGEVGVAARAPTLSYREDPVRRKDLRAWHADDARRHIFDFLIGIEVDVVAMREE